MDNVKDFAFDIVIQAGQSNSEGYGQGPVAEPYVPTDSVWYMHANGDMTVAEELDMGDPWGVSGNFSLPFAREYIQDGKLKNGRKLLILRAAVGGTGFSDNRWKPGDDLRERMLGLTKAALALNAENRLVAFLWHQGETDATLHAAREFYYGYLSGMVKEVRGDFNCPALPFLCADFCHEWRNQCLSDCMPVIQALQDVCADCAPAVFLETDGLTSNNQAAGDGDGIHFSRDALYKMGERFYCAFAELVG